MSSRLLEVNKLKTYYRTVGGDVKAVDDVSFFVEKNEIFGIAGESGCGKSTLARSIIRLVRPPCYIVDGKVSFNGIDILSLEEEELRKIRWKNISYIPQSSMNALNPIMRMGDQIVDAITAHEDLSKREARERVLELIKSVGLPLEAAKMYPHELSGGMKQRAIIAMAMALEPELIIADEPTTALDVNVQRIVLQTLSEVRERLAASLILITHSMAVHAEIVDRLAIMYAGKIVELGNVYDLFENPFHPYTKALMDSIPSLEGKRNLTTSILGTPPNLIHPPSGCRFRIRCPLAMEKCKSVEPIMCEVEAGRFVACHLYMP